MKMNSPAEQQQIITALPPLKRCPRNSCSPPQIYESDPFVPQIHYLIGKKGAESLRTSEPILLPCMSSDPLLRITQLEQNIHFLQEQHHMMLSSLHQEIENLRLRNRDLQFQLIFGNVGVKMLQSSSDSSPEDLSKPPKIILSPKDINNRPLQVEMLEKEVTELKTSLAEANAKNASLLQIIEQQKKELEAAKKDNNADKDAATRLEDADNLIKRLMKENDEQRKEMNTLRSQLSKGSNTGRYGNNRRGGGGGGQSGTSGSGGGGGGGGGGVGGNQDHQRFPPLQTQHYWAHGSQKHKTNNGNHIYRGNSEDSNGENRRRYRGRGNGAHHNKQQEERH